MKRVWLGMLMLAVVTVLATAGAQKEQSSSSAKKTSITVEMSVYVEAPHKAAFDALKAAYEKANPNVEIVYTGAEYANFWDKLVTQIVAGNEAEIVQLQDGNTRYSTYAALRPGETGAFTNLDKYIKGTHWENDLMGQKTLTYNGHYIGVSDYAFGPRAVYYSKSLFEKAGINAQNIRAIDDFLAAAKKLTVKGQGGPDQFGFGAVLSTHPFVWDEMKTFICYPIGATYFPDNKAPYDAAHVSVNSPQMKWAWKWWQSMIFDAKVVPPGSYDKASERDLFWNGTVAMNIDGPWFVGMTRSQDPKLIDNLGVIASPDVVYQGNTYRFNLEDYSITHLVSSRSKNVDADMKFLLWMATPEAQKLVAMSGMIPSDLKFATSDEYQKMEPLNAELTKLATARYKSPGVFDPNIPQLGEMANIMVNAAQAAFINRADVDQTLDKAEAQIQALFKK